jgi:predicted Ser/Thr protein kinase
VYSCSLLQGRVYKAVEEGSGHIVGVKKSRVSVRVKRTSLRHEARILQLLEGHPAIPVLFGYEAIIASFNRLADGLVACSKNPLIGNRIHSML